MFRRRRAVDPVDPVDSVAGRSNDSDDSPRARRLIVVAGSVEEWAAFDEAQWSERLATVGVAAAAAGIESVRIVPSAGDRARGRAIGERRLHVNGCEVLADPRPDGRANVVDAINQMSGSITEESLQSQIGGSGGDVDLVIVLGAPDVLPQALVWELGYAELVYIEADWSTLSSEHVRRSLEEFAVRQRRFGGVIE
ncbi:MAG: undecaprenyl diphosphate synthase family protein [Actinobacteria bacterium]|nr:undecaprenyl diphosphate synthase family protein [Actinomycetota bacterium]